MYYGTHAFGNGDRDRLALLAAGAGFRDRAAARGREAAAVAHDPLHGGLLDGLRDYYSAD
jgi:hypothetical protein